MPMDFWSSLVTFPFSLQADEETAADENKVPIRALVCFVGTKESTGDRGWGCRDGKPLWFRWFKTETRRRSAVCVATGIAVRGLPFASRDSGYFGTDVKAPKWNFHSLLGGLCFVFFRQGVCPCKTAISTSAWPGKRHLAVPKQEEWVNKPGAQSVSAVALGTQQL